MKQNIFVFLKFLPRPIWIFLQPSAVSRPALANVVGLFCFFNSRKICKDKHVYSLFLSLYILIKLRLKFMIVFIYKGMNLSLFLSFVKTRICKVFKSNVSVTRIRKLFYLGYIILNLESIPSVSASSSSNLSGFYHRKVTG